MSKLRQKLQISHSDVVRALAKDWVSFAFYLMVFFLKNVFLLSYDD